eukprot:jgi/Mesen1/3869/ME000207S02876
MSIIVVIAVCLLYAKSTAGGASPSAIEPRNFGAEGDGVTSNTAAFRRAMEALHAVREAGGGRLVVPRGRWLTGPFNLTSHMTLYLEAGAVILASTVRIASKHKHAWAGAGLGWCTGVRLAAVGSSGERSMVSEQAVPRWGPSAGLKVAPDGPCAGLKVAPGGTSGQNGTVDGQGAAWWAAWDSHAITHMRGHLLELQGCQRVRVLDTTFRNAPFWNIHPLYSRHLVFHGLTILAPTHVRETDGINPGGAPPPEPTLSGWDHFGYRLGRPSSFIRVQNVTVVAPGGGGGLAVGSEMSGGVKNVVFENCRIFGAARALRIKSARGRGGYVRRVVFRNIYVQDVSTVFTIDTLFGHGNAPGFDPNALPSIEHISLYNARGIRAHRLVQITGLAEKPIKAVLFANISIPTQVRWRCAHVEGSYRDVVGAPCRGFVRLH